MFRPSHALKYLLISIRYKYTMSSENAIVAIIHGLTMKKSMINQKKA